MEFRIWKGLIKETLMNNTEKDRVAKGCRLFLILSAYFDGENVENKAAIKEHVESCPVCREELRFFEKVASALHVKLSAEEAES
jgi:anti-sigma factor RsiW